MFIMAAQVVEDSTSVAKVDVAKAEEFKAAANAAFQGKNTYILITIDLLYLLFWISTFVDLCFLVICCTTAAHRFTSAIELYSQAIDLNPKNAVYLANRSFAHTKMEEYGSAIEDATKAIEVDPKYVKVLCLKFSKYVLLGTQNCFH